ncbi:CoA ester lyase [bacterium]|nr:CoA ester lyase [bacterium]
MSTRDHRSIAPRLRRSLLFVPGDDRHKMEKACGVGADSLILDLEDAVVPDHKGEARERVRDALLEMDFRGTERLVRLNPIETGLALDDLTVTMAGHPDGYVVPKLRSEDDVRFIDRALSTLEAITHRPQGSVGLVLLATETPEAILNIRRIAQASLRSVAMMWASEDLSNAIGARRSRKTDGSIPDVFTFARSACLLAAAAVGMEALDMPFFDFHDDAGLEREAREAAEMGFTGKAAIHPAQVPIINRVFVPTREEVEEANALLQAATEAFARGQAAFVFNGAMVDAPHINRARKIVARAASAPAAP